MSKIVIGKQACQAIVQRGNSSRTVCQKTKSKLSSNMAEPWGHLVGEYVSNADSPFGVRQYNVKIVYENYTGMPVENNIVCRSPLNMANVPLKSRVIISKNQNTLVWEIIIVID